MNPAMMGETDTFYCFHMSELRDDSCRSHDVSYMIQRLDIRQKQRTTP